MNGNKDILIDDGIHKAFVEVDEEGTKAAATTGWSFPMTGTVMEQPVPIPVFRADHPFSFLIWHKPSKCILFLGRVTNPAAEAKP
jgi:serpin B